MHNLKITFAYPWLWLLLIPAIGFALFTYFRSPKKYRRTRNRIISLCLHIMVIVLCAATLVNTQFGYEINNTQNELLFLIDVSDSNDNEKQAKDDYLYNSLAILDSKSFSVGVVTFGFDQKYSVPLTRDVSSVYEAYKASETDISSESPDATATDIAAALEYSGTLFKNPQTSKIVLISDGYETDENVLSVISSISANGTKVDVVGVERRSPTMDVEVVDAVFPDYNVEKNEEFEIELTIKSVVPSKIEVDLSVTDNDKKTESKISINPGVNTIKIPHTISDSGLHSFKFDVSYKTDEESKNNSLISYMYVEKFDKILVIESYENQSGEIKQLLYDYKVSVFKIDDSELPVTIDALREYDEIILNNISNADLARRKGFDAVLQSYVSDYGGALFTVGGNEKNKDENGKNVAHAYNREDLTTGSNILQTMLPVQAIKYTPPLGLYIIIDVSGSMDSGSEGGVSRKEAACDTALSIVKDDSCLSERDYCGIMTLSDDYNVEIPKPVSMLNQTELRSAIVRIKEGKQGGNTMFGPAINGAGQQLYALKSNHVIEKMHIIVITDGGAADFNASEKNKAYGDYAKEWAKNGVTISFVGVEATEKDVEDMKSVADECNEIAKDTVGKVYNAQIEDLTAQIKSDIRVPEIKEVEEKEFTPVFTPDTAYAKLFSQETIPTLRGFYGVKAKSGTTIMSGDYNVPIYSEWRYGKGMVGSFMCDLQGIWSEKMLADKTGQRLLKTIINKLMPTKSIRKQDLLVEINEDNYINQVSVISVEKLKEGEKVSLTVNKLDGSAAEAKITQPTEGSSYTRGAFEIKTPGVYVVTAKKYAADNSVLAERTIYKSFSYSKEYSMPDEDFDPKAFLAQIAENGDGSAQMLRTADATAVLDGFVTSIKKNYNPTILFMILAIVFFLTDIAVRKFKFKWIHEIVREAKERKSKN